MLEHTYQLKITSYWHPGSATILPRPVYGARRRISVRSLSMVCVTSSRLAFLHNGSACSASYLRNRSSHDAACATSASLKNLLATQYLRRGDGIIATPESRRKARLFSSGRLTLGSSGVKLEKLTGDGYDPTADTCISAFVRLLKEAAEAQGEGEGH